MTSLQDNFQSRWFTHGCKLLCSKEDDDPVFPLPTWFEHYEEDFEKKIVVCLFSLLVLVYFVNHVVRGFILLLYVTICMIIPISQFFPVFVFEKKFQNCFGCNGPSLFHIYGYEIYMQMTPDLLENVPNSTRFNSRETTEKTYIHWYKSAQICLKINKSQQSFKETNFTKFGLNLIHFSYQSFNI